jgi:hypothetical protein
MISLNDADNPTLTPDEMRDGTKLFVATPCFGGNLAYEYVNSLLELLYVCMTNGVNSEIHLAANESLIPRGRNHMVSAFMASECTHMIFIDADIQFKAMDIMKMIAKNKNIIVGAYPLKSMPPEYVVNLKEEDAKADSGLEVMEVLDAGTGFMMMNRGVFETMKENFPELHYTSDLERGYLLGEQIKDEELMNRLKDNLYSFFDTMHDKEDNNAYLSEDYAFCRRWQKVGGRIWLDTTINLNHIGRHAYHGNVSHLQNMISSEANK